MSPLKKIMLAAVKFDLNIATERLGNNLVRVVLSCPETSKQFTKIVLNA